jgi:hypothetical protein
MTKLSTAVRRAIRDSPCSIRALAREAGVSHSTLVLIRGGKIEASLDVAVSVSTALLSWGNTCLRFATDIAAAGGTQKEG